LNRNSPFGFAAFLAAVFLPALLIEDFLLVSVAFPTARSIAFFTNLSVRTFLIDFSIALLTVSMSFLLTFLFAMPKPRNLLSAFGPQCGIVEPGLNAQVQALFQWRLRGLLLGLLLGLFLGGHVGISS